MGTRQTFGLKVTHQTPFDFLLLVQYVSLGFFFQFDLIFMLCWHTACLCFCCCPWYYRILLWNAGALAHAERAYHHCSSLLMVIRSQWCHQHIYLSYSCCVCIRGIRENSESSMEHLFVTNRASTGQKRFNRVRAKCIIQLFKQTMTCIGKYIRYITVNIDRNQWVLSNLLGHASLLNIPF